MAKSKGAVARMDQVVNDFVARCRFFHEPMTCGRAKMFVMQHRLNTRQRNSVLKLKVATGSIGGASSNGDEARDVAGVKVLAKIVEGLDANGTRQLSDTLLSRLKSGIVILGRETDGKVSIVVRVSDDLTGKVKAGNVIKEIVPIVGGRGGGKPDMAEGGGTEPAKLAEAIEASYKAIEAMLS